MKPSGTRRKRVLILGAGFGTANRGVAALACGTLASVFHAFPDAQVALLDYGKVPRTYAFRAGEQSRPIELIALRFSKNVFQRNHVCRLLVTAALLRLLPPRWRARAFARNRWLGPIAAADIVGALSGGDSFSDLYGLRRLLYVSLPQLLVLVVGKPLTLLPQSYGPFQTRAACALARFIVRRAAHVYSRDTDGLELVRRLAPDARTRAAFAYDMGFALEPTAPPAAVSRPLLESRHRRPLVGVNVSGLLYAAGPGDFGLRESYPALMADLVAHLVETRGCAVVLIPHVFGIDGESDVSASLKLLLRLPKAVAGAVSLIDRELDQHEVKGTIGQCDFFVGARMHACIAALSQAVPAMALAYSGKFAGVLASLDARHLLVDLRVEDRSRVLAAVGGAFDARRTLQAELAVRSRMVRRQVLDFFATLPAVPPPARPPAPALFSGKLDPARPT